jgi:SHS2 domain-containing protein
MAEYELLEHTADTGFRVRGMTLEELFRHAAEALVAIAMDASRIEPRERRSVGAMGENIEERLVNWLNEVLWLLDGQHWAPGRFDELRLEGASVSAIAGGEPRDDVRHPPRIVVKAVTFHQLAVMQREDGWEASVFLDI